MYIKEYMIVGELVPNDINDMDQVTRNLISIRIEDFLFVLPILK